MSACARAGVPGGCKPLPRQHAPGCADHDCTGCAPEPATRGNLGEGCSRRLRAFLGAEEGTDPERPVHGLPWAYDHLGEAYPSLAAPTAGSGTGVRDREAERLAAVLDVRRDMLHCLSFWTTLVQLPTGLTGPDVLNRPQRIRVRRYADWLLRHAEQLESAPSVADGWDAFAGLMSRAHALAPWRPAPTRARGVPCWCGHLSIYDYGDEYQCATCRRSFTHAQFTLLARAAVAHYGSDLDRYAQTR